MSWRAVVLAAGQGTRMKSDLAKVLHRLEDETLLGHVLRTASSLPIERTIAVVGHQHERVRAEHERWGIEFVLQQPQLGTGHAVQQAAPLLAGHEGSTLILYGDVPLLRRSTLLELMEEHERVGNAVTVLTARVPDPTGYGRMVRGPDGSLQAIVEHKDLSPEQGPIDEINSGIYTFRTPLLLESLAGLRNDNQQGEYYLTDTVEALRLRGFRVGTYTLADPEEISGINTPEQLAQAGDVLHARRRAGSEDCPVCDLGARAAAVPDAGRIEPGFPVLAVAPHAFLAVALRPYNSGQLVVHPLRHVLRHASLGASETADLWGLARRAAAAVENVYHPQGMNLGYASGRPGQHLALQVVPRWVGDTNFLPLFGDLSLLPETLHETWEQLHGSLSGVKGGG